MRTSLVVAGALSFALGPALAAQITTATFTDGSHYDYQFKNLPDLDQRRAFSGPILGLPGDGDQYCVPTSSMNMVAYIAAHGYPSLPPGDHDWTDPATYDIATLAIMNIGTFMGTTPGTKGGGFTGLIDWMAGSGPFIFLEDYANGNHAPTLTTITEVAMLGPLVEIVYGRYQIVGTFNGLPLVSRSGGHCMTLARTHANGASDKKMWTRDPADPNDGMELTQSTFANHQFSITPKTVYISGSPPRKLTMSVLDFDSTSTKLACIDKYMAVLGIGAIFAKNGALNSLGVYQPVALAGLPTNSTMLYPIGSKILDASLDPDHFGITFLTASALQNLNTITGAITHLGSFPTATRVLHGRNRELYVLSDHLLQTFDPEDDTPVVKSLPLPDLAQALCYDAAHDQVILLSTSLHALFRCTAGLPNLQEPQIIQLPGSAPVGGAGSITVRAADGRYWFVSDASDSIFGVLVTGTGVSSVETISNPAIAKPIGIDCDDKGRLFVWTTDKLFVLAKGPNSWQIVSDPLWDAYPPDPCFHLMNSHTNFNPATMAGPGYDDLTQADLAPWEQGPSIPDCGNDAADNVYGVGKPGTMGVPALAALDPPFLGAPTTVQMTHALPGATPILLAGLSQQALPFDKGTLLVTPTFVVSWPVPVDGNGNVSITVTLPGDVSLCGVTLYEQLMFVDPGAIGFHHSAQTNGLARTLGS